MNGTPFDRLKQIFNTAIELPAGDRSAYLDAQHDIDDHTRRQLDDLLHADAWHDLGHDLGTSIIR